MANPDHVLSLNGGSERWNAWRREHPEIRPDLSGIDLQSIDTSFVVLMFDAPPGNNAFVGYDFSKCILDGIDFTRINLSRVSFTGASLRRCSFACKTLDGRDLSGCDLSGANLSECRLVDADLSDADLSGADLTRAVLVRTRMGGCNLSGAEVYGTAVWDVDLAQARQNDLQVTGAGGGTIQVDSLRMAQFIYMLIANRDIREFIDSLTSRTILILGRFQGRTSAVLTWARAAVREHGLHPLVFDTAAPESLDLQETIVVLAGLARLVIADVTEPRSVPAELTAILAVHPALHLLQLVEQGHQPYALHPRPTKYLNVEPLLEYEAREDVFTRALSERIRQMLRATADADRTGPKLLGSSSAPAR